MDYKKVIGNRIKSERINIKLTQEELAAKLGLNNKSSISQYESGDAIPSDDVKLKMCEIFGCSLDYLLGKSDVKNVDKNFVAISTTSNNTAVVLVYGNIPAGIPMECIEDIIGTEEIPAEWIKGDKQFFGLRIKGNSMSPSYLNGDIIILEKVDDCESGEDCVVMVNGNDGTFKRVIKSENGIVLQPLNNDYTPISYSNEQIENLPVKILGVVRELRRTIKNKSV